MPKGFGIMGIGYVLGGLNLLLTAGVFFSRGETFLALIELFIFPAELVLPWFASPALGIMSLVSLGLVIAGGSIES